MEKAKRTLALLDPEHQLLADKTLLTQDHYEEAYIAVTTNPGNAWVWLHPWLCGGTKASKTAALDRAKPISIDTFVTGTCLFGDHLIGHTITGQTLLLTNPKEPIPEGVIIIDVTAQGNKHAYELMTHKQLDYLFPIFKAIAIAHFQLAFHLPVPEYLLQGISWYQQGKMTLTALKSYITLVVERGYTHKMLLKAFTLQTGCKLTISSPLDSLKLQLLKSMTLDALEVAVNYINLDTLLKDLKRHPMWLALLESKPITSYQELGYRSYVAHVALNTKTTLNTAVVDLHLEKPICMQYEKLLPHSPLILALHYLPAVVPQNPRASWFFTHGQEPQLNQLIRQGDYHKAASTGSVLTLKPG